MKNLLTLGLIFLPVYCLAQQKLPADPFQQKNSLFSFHFGITDYETLYNQKQKGSSSGIISKTGKKSFGIGVGWWKSLREHFDFNARYTGTFAVFPKNFISKDTIGTASFSNELDGSMIYRFFNEKAQLNPFISAGVGAGFYNPGAGVYAPIGAGLQLHTASGFYAFLQGQWKMNLAGEPTNSYLHYSIGIAQGISRFKPPKIFIPSLAIPVILDSDDDGVPDENDDCPDEKGPVASHGCPDADGDIVPDKLDRCPDLAGLIRYNGCAIPDTDKDGVNDEEDRCPDEPGMIRHQGCTIPDTDKDGVNDEDDKCPELAGDIANHGCPEVKKEIQQKVNLAARYIQFKSSSDELLPNAKEALNEIAALLKSDPLMHLDIEGHTDNTGNNNQLLSVKRAAAVRNFLLNKNISAARLSSTGFGDKNPVADNETPEGRAMNRRVEMRFRY